MYLTGIQTEMCMKYTYPMWIQTENMYQNTYTYLNVATDCKLYMTCAHDGMDKGRIQKGTGNKVRRVMRVV